MRLDKYLKVSRLIKRRTIANEACDAGRVTVNGKVARASYEVKQGTCWRSPWASARSRCACSKSRNTWARKQRPSCTRWRTDRGRHKGARKGIQAVSRAYTCYE